MTLKQPGDDKGVNIYVESMFMDVRAFNMYQLQFIVGSHSALNMRWPVILLHNILAKSLPIRLTKKKNKRRWKSYLKYSINILIFHTNAFKYTVYFYNTAILILLRAFY